MSESVEKTILKRLKSRSTTAVPLSGYAQTMLDLAFKPHPDDLSSVVAQCREEQFSVVRSHNPRLSAADVNHLESALRYLTAKYINGLAFVRNIRAPYTGDIGIVYGISYQIQDAPKKKEHGESSAEILLPLGSEPTMAVYFHLQVALPNGMSTTWRLSSAERVPNNEGFVEFKSFYWDTAAIAVTGLPFTE